MSLGYRSVLRLRDDEDAIRVANEQFRSWLAEQVRDKRKSLESADWDGPGTYQLGPESVLNVVEQHGEGLSRQLLEFVDSNEHGVWTTRLYATSAPGSNRLKQVLWFESEGTRPDGSSVQPATPRVVRNTLQAVEAFDGSVPVLSEPRVVHIDDVDDLIGYIEDPQRDISVVVASPVPGVAVDRWRAAVATLTRDALGCASFFILDGEAEQSLNANLGGTHKVPAGAVRTFVPRVEVGDWADARRHRILTARTMSQGLGANLRFSERLIRAVATTPRMHLREADMPAELTRSVRVLQREQLQFAKSAIADITVEVELAVSGVVEAAEGEAADVIEPAWLDRLKEVVRKVVGHDRVDHDSLAALADKFEQQEAAVGVAIAKAEQLLAERERFEDQTADLRRQLEAEQFERALAEVARREAEKKTRSLERWRNDRTDRYTFVEDPVTPLEADPVNVSEIIERLTDSDAFADILQYVELTDVDRAIDRADEVDAVDPNGTYAAAFWEYILVLRDYMAECVEHGFSGNLHMYLNSDTVRGRKCPVQRHKPNESETVQNNSAMRRERTFPVVQEVDPSGEVFMSTHFAPTHRDQNAPRLYYFADVAVTGKAYVGYIGVHLTNTRTN